MSFRSSRSANPMNGLIGKTLGQYRITEQLGKGGMAEVFKAFQPALNRYVAVKVLHPFVATEEGFLARFQREAQSVAALRHPHIVQVFDFGSEGDLYFMVMEFVQGPTLKKRIAERTAHGDTFSPEEAARIIRQVAQALDYAHRKGMIHRDVKPANILLTGEGEAVLSDFGVARMMEGPRYTLTGIMGTPDYMSPEQGMGQEVDARSDVYALGVVLYEMLTGDVPFKADTPMAVVLKHIQDPLPLPRQVAPGIPEPVERVILKALAKEPADRYASAGALAKALTQAIAAASAPPLPEPPAFDPATLLAGETPPTAERARQSLPWLPLAAGAGFLILALAAVLLIPGLLNSNDGAMPTAAARAAISPTPAAIALPTDSPTPEPIPTPTPLLTATPTPAPMATSRPTRTPTASPTAEPSPTPPIVVPNPGPAEAQRIAFVSYRDGNSEIYTMNLDGSDQQRLTERPGDDWHPSWSSDGRQIVFQSFEPSKGTFNIFVMNRDGSGLHPITYWDKTITGGGAGAQRPVWSPDGTRIAFSFEGADLTPAIYVANADGSDLRQLTLGRDPSWSPDSQRIAFEYRPESALEIFTIHVDGSGQTQITSTGDNNMYATWSPDGQFIAYVRQEAAASGIYLLDLSSGRTRKLKDKSSWGLSWSPDGLRLAFAPNREGIWTLAIEQPLNAAQIDPEGTMPAWSP
jgi:serine/threonine protein kinase